MVVLDAGCGVGGPMREIARHSGARVVGVTIVSQQVEMARRYNERAGLSQQCEVMLADFMDLPMDDASYDRVYAIGATCHAPDRTRVFKELFRVLKPGGLLATDECLLTDRYDPDDPEHQRIRLAFERGYGIPDTITAAECCRSMIAAGFELLEADDHATESDPETPWWTRQPRQPWAVSPGSAGCGPTRPWRRTFRPQPQGCFVRPTDIESANIEPATSVVDKSQAADSCLDTLAQVAEARGVKLQFGVRRARSA